MDFSTIQKLSWYLPVDKAYDDSVELDYRAYNVPNLQEVTKGVRDYSDLSFGWRFAHTLVKHDLPLPSIIGYNERFVRRLYWVLKGRRDPVIETAMQLAFYPDMLMPRLTLCSSIITHKARLNADQWQTVADSLSLSVEVCYAFEKLFFNISDRMEDEKFLRMVIYPHSRFVETQDDYTQKESMRNLLLRSGYNNGLKDLLQMAGDRDMFRDVNSSQEFAEKMEAKIMANGVFLMDNGWLHTDTKVMKDARVLIAAAKAGGQEGMDDNPMNYAGDLIMDTLQKAAEHNRIQHLGVSSVA